MDAIQRELNFISPLKSCWRKDSHIKCLVGLLSEGQELNYLEYIAK